MRLPLLIQPDCYTLFHSHPEHFWDITTTPQSLVRKGTHLGVDGKKAQLLKKTIPPLARSITHNNAEDWRHQDHHLWQRSFNTAKGPQYNGCISAIASSKHTLLATNQPPKLMNHPHQQHRARYYSTLIPLKPLPTNYQKRLIMSSTSENIPTLFGKQRQLHLPISSLCSQDIKD